VKRPDKKACCVTQIKLTLDAERDLIDIYLYGIENFGHAQAERYAATLNEKMAVAADYPSFGADYSFVRSGLRRRECVSHAIYYHTTTLPPLAFWCCAFFMDAWTPASI